MANLRAENVQQKRKIIQLEDKVKRLTETSGVEVDEQMHGDLSENMDEMASEVENKFIRMCVLEPTAQSQVIS